MNTILLFSLLFTSTVYSQEEIVTEESTESVETVEENIETPPDTTRVNLGKTEFIIVGHALPSRHWIWWLKSPSGARCYCY